MTKTKIVSIQTVDVEENDFVEFVAKTYLVQPRCVAQSMKRLTFSSSAHKLNSYMISGMPPYLPLR